MHSQVTSKKKQSFKGIALLGSALFVVLTLVSGCGAEGESDNGFSNSSSTRPTSCAVMLNASGHPQSCQCPTGSTYDGRNGVCSKAQ